MINYKPSLFKNYYFLIIFAFFQLANAQVPIFNQIAVSDVGFGNNIGEANTSRNVAIDDNGVIYVVFAGSEGIRVAKSVNRGQNFSASVQVSLLTNVEPEITVNSQGIVFVAWVNGTDITLSRSVDGGNTFSMPVLVGNAGVSGFENAVHMTTFDSNIYLVDTVGNNVYSNSNNGIGIFNHITLPFFVYADILTDQNGVVYAPRDNPTLDLFFSTDSGQNFTNTPLSPGGDVFYSSYSFSDGPCGRFIFVAGSGTLGFKIDVETGTTIPINFGNNSFTSTGRTLFSDNQGTLIDGYRDSAGNLVMNVSFNQGDTFTAPIVIANGESHNLARNDMYNDIVVAYEQSGQIFVSVYNGLLKSIEITNPVPPINTCAGTSFDLPFTLTGTFGADTTFTAQLSDADGSFENSTNIGILVTNMNGVITCTLPLNLEASDQYRILIDSLVDCTQSEPITISINNPQVSTPPSLIECEDNNGEAVFDLTSQSSVISNNQPGFEVTYYLSNNEAESGLNEIPIPDNYSVSTSTTIWARMESLENNICYDVLSFNLILNDLPIVNDASLTQCDVDADNSANFNLNLSQPQISNDFINEDFSYFYTQIGAKMNMASDQIVDPTSFIASQGDVVYARIQTVNNCFRTARLDLSVDVGGFPVGFVPNFLEVCDDNVDGDAYNGVASFDLTDTEAEIRNAYPLAIQTDLIINFYTSLTDAEIKTNSITTITDYENIGFPNTQTIWVRIDDAIDNNDCRGLVELTNFLTVHPIPIINTLSPLQECSNISDANFNLENRLAEINNNQLHPLRVTFFREGNALINNPTNFNSTGETIFVRAQFDADSDGVDLDDLKDCISDQEMFFDLVVLQNPTNIAIPKPQTKCSNQVETVYDLTDSEIEIINEELDLTLNYFETQGTNAGALIVDPVNYISETLLNTILVEVTAVNGCTNTVNLELITTLYEAYNTTPITLEECEIDTNGIDIFNLTRVETDILNGLNASDFNFNYYLIEEDADAHPVDISLAIFNPEGYENTSNPQTVYARVAPNNSPENACFQIIPINLVVNSVPQIDIEPEYVICLNSDGLVLNPVTETFLPDSIIDTQLSEVLYSFKWYAGTEQEVIDNPGMIIISGQTTPSYAPTQGGFYTVIATDNNTGCTIPATTKVVESFPPESIIVSLTTEAFSGTNTLEVSVVGNGSYEYSLDHSSWQDSFRFTNVIGGDHIVFVRDLYNCNVISQVKAVIDYPKFFTPNGDGYNDTWNISNIESQVDAKIYVYDRYGKLIKQLSPVGTGWDGTYRGIPLPENDYWFTIDYTEPIANIKKQFKAHFTLKR